MDSDEARLARIKNATATAIGVVDRLATDEDLRVLSYELNDSRDDLRESLAQVEQLMHLKQVPRAKVIIAPANGNPGNVVYWDGVQLYVNGRHFTRAKCTERVVLANQLDALYRTARAK